MDSLESGVGTESHRRITRRWLVVLSACTLLGLFVGGAPSTAQNEKQKPADYPEQTFTKAVGIGCENIDQYYDPNSVF